MLREHAALIADIERDWAAAGLSGSLLARNLDTGAELGFGAGIAWPLASVIKLPLAVVVHDAFERGELDPAEPFELDPDRATSGPTGVSLFRHPSRVAAEDLMQLALAVSDNAATDALLERIGIETVTERLAGFGFAEIVLRHPMRAIYGMSGAVAEVGLGLAAGATTPGGGHLIGELDPHRANVGTARALLDLLDRLWTDRISTPAACARLRAALGHQLTRHRLAVELASDEVRVLSKTGTFLDLRHEAGVVEAGPDRVAVVALTRSSIPASVQLEAEFAIGHAGRLAVDALRG
ncbi:serine hydrolase [Naumannella cuiyingiana]|uniref:Beta-lactamase class A n=1 Tax=Naumannella cuiyingiana TaxID=1347891 RepID=A0A7Z0ILF3_9ACTN|nr:serine hydrolase [Naumannella cuiyingiana]NYI71570.1 beta-lactamase class A [Naumannella cuiyingiana]